MTEYTNKRQNRRISIQLPVTVLIEDTLHAGQSTNVSFGGMFVVIVSIFVVPVLYCSIKEFSLKTKQKAT